MNHTLTHTSQCPLLFNVHLFFVVACMTQRHIELPSRNPKASDRVDVKVTYL